MLSPFFKRDPDANAFTNLKTSTVHVKTKDVLSLHLYKSLSWAVFEYLADGYVNYPG